MDNRIKKIARRAFDKRLTVRNYRIVNNKITGSIRIALVTDLHSCNYGKGQKELLDCLAEHKPDLLMLGGDIVDDRLSPEDAITFVKAAAEGYPCYYVSGNHEIRSGRAKHYKQQFIGYGVTVLEGICSPTQVNGQIINICGIDDAIISKTAYIKQLRNTKAGRDQKYFSILLSHRPEQIIRYLNYEFDLVVVGHAHGGQWRIPGLINGLYAPAQGLFPRYAGGLYDFGGTTLIVSRGLARETTWVPRIFNPPELVVIDILPAQGSKFV